MSTKKTGLDALLTPEESVLLLIDHQPFQFANLHSHEPTMIVNNVVGLAKTAKAFGVPTILTTVLEERGGYLPPAGYRPKRTTWPYGAWSRRVWCR
jgi:nicotinamidase-related amidase